MKYNFTKAELLSLLIISTIVVLTTDIVGAAGSSGQKINDMLGRQYPRYFTKLIINRDGSGFLTRDAGYYWKHLSANDVQQFEKELNFGSNAIDAMYSGDKQPFLRPSTSTFPVSSIAGSVGAQSVHIAFSSASTNYADYRIDAMDALGKTIAVREGANWSKDNSVDLDTRSFPTGIYTFRVSEHGLFISAGKFFVIH